MKIQTEIARVCRENDLLRKLLAIADATDVSSLIREALPIAVEATGASIGYLEIQNLASDSNRADWWITHGVGKTEENELREAVSRGVIAQTIATERTIESPSALVDPRFSERESVQLGRIESVLCVPIGYRPAIGALYLQGGEEQGPFDARARSAAELFADQISRHVNRVLAQIQPREIDDPTREWRDRVNVEPLIGRSRAIASLLREIAAVSALDVGVLLTGESGTGKSLVARMIHDNSKRKSGRFVEINCGAIPEGLVESELFGAVPGAHSTATRRIAGKVAAANQGTLFLDEVGELQLTAQAKLLQLLQSHTYFPLGSDRPETANIRVIAATNSDLKHLIKEGRFREDLFYRLHVVATRVPSLSERPEDIPDLARYFSNLASETHGLPYFSFSPQAVDALQYADWPGNVRQLAHSVEAAIVRATGNGDRQLEIRHLFPEFNHGQDDREVLTFQDATRNFQANLLARTLAECGWNVSETSHRLNVARSHVYALIRAFGLKRQ